MRSTAWAMALGAAIAAAAGCGAGPHTTPTLTSASSTSATPATVATAPLEQPRTVKWVDLDAGDCLADPPPSDPAVVQVAVVDCASPHLAEAYLRMPIPVNTALDDVATKDCATGLQRYTGAAPEAGGYTTTYLIDSVQDRTSDNPYPSTVICLLQAANGQSLTGSARR